jgi:DNA-binding NtrC family response regulator
MNEQNLTVCVIDDESDIREGVTNLLRSEGLKVQAFASAQEFLTNRPQEPLGCLVLDVQLPGISGLDLQQDLASDDAQVPIVFITGYGDIPTAVRAMKAGAIEFLTKPLHDEDLISAVGQAISRSCQSERRKSKSDQLSDNELGSDFVFSEMVGQSDALRRVLQQVETVAPTDSTVLILGETGTGKELVARAVHNASRRHGRTFVKLNCAAIPMGLLESELFGHEKGAFTGAITQRIGRLELAHQGTLFLDEVGEIPLDLQPKLLGVLQEREFERIGSSKTTKIDVRLVAATNRNLREMTADHRFRSDLYYRLNVFPIGVPPLRERKEDIPLLVHHFAQKFARRMEKQINAVPPTVMERLVAAPWRGNIRELEHLIERAVILTTGNVLNVPLADLSDIEPAPGSATPFLSDERDRIVQMLKKTKNRIGGPAGAAAALGLKRTTLISRMKKLGIGPQKAS